MDSHTRNTKIHQIIADQNGGAGVVDRHTWGQDVGVDTNLCEREVAEGKTRSHNNSNWKEFHESVVECLVLLLDTFLEDENDPSKNVMKACRGSNYRNSGISVVVESEFAPQVAVVFSLYFLLVLLWSELETRQSLDQKPA